MPNAIAEYELIASAVRSSGSFTSSNLSMVEEETATGEVAELYDYFRIHFGRSDVPGILKCFATHPPLLRHMMDLSESLIFAEGHLSRKHKEMIATLVSAQNSCPYCADSHAFFLRVQGGSPETLSAICADDLVSPAFSPGERALLLFVRKVNLNSQGINRSDVDQLMEAGWGEEQIAEAVHVASLFATFNRVANAFGLPSQGLLALYSDEA